MGGRASPPGPRPLRGTARRRNGDGGRAAYEFTTHTAMEIPVELVPPGPRTSREDTGRMTGGSCVFLRSESKCLEPSHVTSDQGLLLRAGPPFQLSLAVQSSLASRVCLPVRKNDRSTPRCVRAGAPSVMSDKTGFQVARLADIQRLIRAAENVDETHTATTMTSSERGVQGGGPRAEKPLRNGLAQSRSAADSPSTRSRRSLAQGILPVTMARHERAFGSPRAGRRRVEWWARMESNHRPPACEADALPLSHAPDQALSLACGRA